MRVLSIDPALRKTGFAVLHQPGETEESGISAVAYGVICNDSGLTQSGCLVAIREQLHDIIAQHRPEVCAIESVIYVQSFKTAITMGAARAAALIAAGESGLSIFEYPPRRVKQAIVGRGAAEKQQVAFMVRSLLKLTETPPPDAADALAIGLTHLYAARSGNPLASVAPRI